MQLMYGCINLLGSPRAKMSGGSPLATSRNILHTTYHPNPPLSNFYVLLTKPYAIGPQDEMHPCNTVWIFLDMHLKKNGHN